LTALSNKYKYESYLYWEANMQSAKPAVQERSRKTRAALLAAMGRLLGRKPFAEITVAELAAEAAVSPASIYQRFSNRDALVAILIELYMEAARSWASSPAGRLSLEGVGDLHEALRRVAAQSWDMVEALGHVMRPAYLQSRLRPDLPGEQWSALEAKSREGFRALLAMFPADLHGADPEAAGDALACHFNMMLVARLLHWPAPGISTMPQTQEEYGTMLADFACGYLAQRSAR
jgi:AcrR family transcriptional regulator